MVWTARTRTAGISRARTSSAFAFLGASVEGVDDGDERSERHRRGELGAEHEGPEPHAAKVGVWTGALMAEGEAPGKGLLQDRPLRVCRRNAAWENCWTSS